METWQEQPLGFAIADETSKGKLAIHHVSVMSEGIFASGLWGLSKSSSKTEIQDRITHWIPVGTTDGIAALQDRVGKKFKSADLSELVAACEEEEAQLQREWEKYRDEAPKKRANLKPLSARSWPAVHEDGDAAKWLKRVGRRPYSPNTPPDMRDIIAFSRLVIYIMEVWFDLESEGLGRHYLHKEDDERDLFPREWLKKHRPYWPKVA